MFRRDAHAEKEAMGAQKVRPTLSLSPARHVTTLSTAVSSKARYSPQHVTLSAASKKKNALSWHTRGLCSFGSDVCAEHAMQAREGRLKESVLGGAERGEDGHRGGGGGAGAGVGGAGARDAAARAGQAPGGQAVSLPAVKQRASPTSRAKKPRVQGVRWRGAAAGAGVGAAEADRHHVRPPNT
eukprot:552500-Rhodomonas_salina.1